LAFQVIIHHRDLADENMERVVSPKADPDPWTSKDIEPVPAVASHHEDAAPRKLGDALYRDVDVAMTLFDHPDQIHEARDPDEERRLVRKIDFMILPYLAVCYAFFYIDKTTLSYAGEFVSRRGNGASLI
jgi:hypothetical protein